MRICYCEDEVAQADFVKKLILELAKKNSIPVQVDLFQSSEEFLFKEEEPYDLLLLDISMGKMNGMELAKKIRQKDSEVVIVFVTSDASFVFEGYEVGAYRYIMKPIKEDKLYELLEFVQNNRSKHKKKYVLLRIEYQTVNLAVDEVIYIEVRGHYIDIHRENQDTITIKSSLAEIMSLMNEESITFATAHRSFAVNISKIQRIGRTECTLTGGEKIPVSRGMYKALNETFIEFHKKGRLT